MTERVTVIESESEALVIETPGGAEVFDRRDADVVVVQEGVQGPPGPPGSAASAHLQLAAGAPLGGHRAVRASGGQAVYADCRPSRQYGRNNSARRNKRGEQESAWYDRRSVG